MARNEFIGFSGRIPDEAKPIIAGILSDKVPEFAKLLDGRRGSSREEHLLTFFYHVAKATGQNAKEGSETYLTELVTRHWRNLAAGKKPSSNEMLFEAYHYLHTTEAGKPIAESIDRAIFDGKTYEQHSKKPVPGGYIPEIDRKSSGSLVSALNRKYGQIFGARIFSRKAMFSSIFISAFILFSSYFVFDRIDIENYNFETVLSSKNYWDDLPPNNIKCSIKMSSFGNNEFQVGGDLSKTLYLRFPTDIISNQKNNTDKFKIINDMLQNFGENIFQVYEVKSLSYPRNCRDYAKISVGLINQGNREVIRKFLKDCTNKLNEALDEECVLDDKGRYTHRVIAGTASY